MIAREIAAITVNGIAIRSSQIEEEMLNHTAECPQAARQASIRALVVRELLLQEAVRWGLCDLNNAINKPEEAVERLLAVQIKIPDPDEASCERYYKDNSDNFSTASQCEASHIFFPAPLADAAARRKARQKAERVLLKIKQNPDCFDEIARLESACPSAAKGGALGQILKGQTVAAFEAALMGMSKGEISSEPVETEVGIHIIRVDERVDGEELPFLVLKKWIFEYLRGQGRQKAIDGYVRGLADKSEIIGFEFEN